ncbi:uracil-DNA glycosylase [Chlamydiia bacterium]|nr:uracil-DNA glycosylase [Chlamydiia bacterium]
MHHSWVNVLNDIFERPFMHQLNEHLINECDQHIIFPPKKLWFNTFNITYFDQVKVVILGQDPYHGDGQAHGLSFSVPNGVSLPPSLRNIYKELITDIVMPMPTSGSLLNWAQQGVLLLNCVLTVRSGEAGSHRNMGWETFTDHIIRLISNQHSNIVFILWGAYAIKKKQLINTNQHCIIESAHPSPLSAHRGFFGSKPFSRTNKYLLENNLQPIDWRL